MNADAFDRLVKSVPINSVGWFDLFDRSGQLEKWLGSQNVDSVRYAIGLLTQPIIVKDRGEAVARYIRQGLERVANPSPERDGYLSAFSLAQFVTNEALFSLFLERFAAGDFDEQRDLWWSQFHSLPEVSPQRAVQLLEIFLERREAIAKAKGQTDPFEEKDNSHSLPTDIAHRLANVDPSSVVQKFLPRVVRLIKTHEREEREDGLQLNTIWPFISQNPFGDFKYSLLEGLRQAMERLSERDPARLDALTHDLEKLPHRTIAYLLLSAWSANGAYYAGRIIDYLLAHEGRFNLGFDTWGTGNGIAAISRAAVAAATNGATPEMYDKMEAAVLTLHPPEEKKRPQRFGLLQFLLLTAIGEKRLSLNGKRRLQEWSRKFEGVDTSPPGVSGGAHFVPSPIPTEALPKMNDEQWLQAMLTYQSEDPERKINQDFMTGGSVEVSRQLGDEARHDKERFAQLALKMGPNIPKIYHDAIVSALVASKEEQPNVQKGMPAKLASLATATLIPVFRHVHNLPGKPCGRWLCSAIGGISRRELPNELLEMVAYYCTDDPDPVEVGVTDRHYFGGDLVQYGINTTRGAAVVALSELLFAEPKRWPFVENAVLSATKDIAVIVQACSVSCILALLNIDRNRATNLFLEMISNEKALIGTMFVRQFLDHRAYADYAKLRDVLLLMLRSEDNEQRETAAACIAAASFGNAQAKVDIETVLTMDENCRAAVAGFAAHNFGASEIIDTCRTWLIRFFDDESRKVRDAASHCFHRLSEDVLANESLLIGAFIDSRSFQEHAYNLLNALQGSVSRLPDIVLKIPEKAVALHEADSSQNARHARWWTNEMATLVLRLYEQTRDQSIKSKCLDVLDRMIELNFGSFAKELEKVDRS